MNEYCKFKDKQEFPPPLIKKEANGRLRIRGNRNFLCSSKQYLESFASSKEPSIGISGQ